MNTCYDSAMSENDKLINFIANTVESLRQRVDTINEQMATKNDLGRLETSMRGEFEQVHLRLDSIDRRVGTRIGQVETDVSRLRSGLFAG